MRAVNLVPEEERRGAGGAAGRSGGAAYVLLGLLAALVVLATTYAVQHRSLGAKRTQLAQLEADAARGESRAAELASFSQFASLRADRVQTVTGLASSRFDWSHSLRELARVIPSNVWLTSLQGTVAPGVTLQDGGGGATSTLRAALPTPAIEMLGCTTNQDSVARMLTRMRLMDGVSRVSLQSSAKGDAASGGGSSATGDCRAGRAKYPQFALVVFFDQAAGAVPTTTLATRRIATAVGATGPTGQAPGGSTGSTGATP